MKKANSFGRVRPPTFQAARLATRSDSRPMPQTLGHSLHEVERKVRRLLDEKLEPILVDRGQSAVRPGNRRRAAWARVDERHFSQETIHANRFDDLVVNNDVHFSFEHNIHLVAGFAFLENGVTRLERDEVFGIPEEMTKLHARQC